MPDEVVTAQMSREHASGSCAKLEKAIGGSVSVSVSACPFHPFSAEYLADPYPTFADVREEAPAFFSDELDMWVV